MKHLHYKQARARIEALLDGEADEVAIMATVACELHHAMDHFNWTGFYRVSEPGLLKIGPYQGSHGCLSIPFERGVCGAVARTEKLLRLDDVHSFPGHIACSHTTKSEIVLPVHDRQGRLRAVLDIDSDQPAAFDETDEQELTDICATIGQRLG